MGWMVRGSDPAAGEICRTHLDRLWCPLSPLYSGYWIFSGDKSAAAWHSPPTLSSRG